MSVFKRYQSLSRLQCFRNAREVRAKVTSIVMNHKLVHKKYRLIFAKPIGDIFFRLFARMEMANAICMDNPENYRRRVLLQELAIEDAMEIYQVFQYILDVEPIKLEKFKKVLTEIYELIGLLERWRDWAINQNPSDNKTNKINNDFNYTKGKLGRTSTRQNFAIDRRILL